MHPDEACWTFVPKTGLKMVLPRCTGLSIMRYVAKAETALQQCHLDATLAAAAMQWYRA